MSRRLTLLFAIALWSASLVAAPGKAAANVVLTRAVVQQLRNIVQLIPTGRSARPARVADNMAAGDALSTSRASFAELRFNDGSLARLGEQVIFRFVPDTRTFRLSNGTVLLLVPPGQGRTQIRTPNATAGIRGSALFVRYIPGTNTTLVGALTDSGIEVFNDNESQQQELQAGQLAVIVEDQIQEIYEFDLNTFYETSELVQGLNLTQLEDESESSDQALNSVRAETVAAIAAQSDFDEAEVVDNPNFIRLDSVSTTLPRPGTPSRQNSNPGVSPPSSGQAIPPVTNVLDAGEIQANPTDPDDPDEQPVDPESPIDSPELPTDPTPPVDPPEPPTDPTPPVDPPGPPPDPTPPVDPPGPPPDPTPPIEPPIETPEPGPPIDPPGPPAEPGPPVEPPIETPGLPSGPPGPPDGVPGVGPPAGVPGVGPPGGVPGGGPPGGVPGGGPPGPPDGVPGVGPPAGVPGVGPPVTEPVENPIDVGAPD